MSKADKYLFFLKSLELTAADTPTEMGSELSIQDEAINATSGNGMAGGPGMVGGPRDIGVGRAGRGGPMMEAPGITSSSITTGSSVPASWPHPYKVKAVHPARRMQAPICPRIISMESELMYFLIFVTSLIMLKVPFSLLP
jgi:hypothetical protein